MMRPAMNKDVVSTSDQNLLKQFDVVITETLTMVVKVDAKNPDEAEQIVSDKWEDGEYVLDYDNFADVDFEANEIGTEKQQFDPVDPNREIAITWSVDDVKHIRPDLTDDQAMDVLYEVKDHHDAEWGVSWTTLSTAAEILFPKISGN